MTGLVKNEMYKVIKQKKFYIFMGIIFILIVLNALSVSTLQSKLVSEIFNGQSFPLNILNWISLIIVIFITVLIADLVTDEHKNGTLKLSLIRPITRNNLITAKLISLFVTLLIIQVFTFSISYIIGTIFFGWGHNLTFIGTEFNIFNGLLFTLVSYMFTILPYMAFGTIILFISLLSSSVGVTIAISLGSWFLISLVGQMFTETSPYIITTYFNFYVEFVNDIVVKDILVGFAVILGYGIIFSLASLLLFKKKNILY